jgi:hypothetical protein
MEISRRRAMQLVAGAPFLRGFVTEAANLPEFRKPPDSIAPVYPGPSEVDRLLSRAPGPAAETHCRKYSVEATVTLLGIPLASKTHVGSGYARVETTPGAQGSLVAIRFAAGSWPESARGLNRVGYIEEVVSEQAGGAPAACAYFAFMTASEEKNLEQARKALESAAGETSYSIACGAGNSGRFASRLTRLRLPSGLTWRNLTELARIARAASGSDADARRSECDAEPGAASPATFLYAIRKAIASAERETEQMLVYNGRQYRLKTAVDADASMGARLAERRLARADRVMRLNASLKEERTGQISRFQVWFEPGPECAPPLRFEYQAKSFLRLAFQADPEAAGPSLPAFFHKEENV